MNHKLRLAAVTLGACAFVVATAGASLATNKCAGSKVKATGKKAKCKLGVYGKAAGSGDPVDTVKLTTCETKFSQSFAKAEAKATKEPCSTTGDASDLEAKVDAFVTDVLTEIDVAPTPSKCQGSKLKAAGKKAACRLKLVAGFKSKGVPIDPTKDATCKSKFSSASVKAEAQGDCGTAAGDTSAIEGKVDAFVADVDTELPGVTPTTGCCGALPSLLSFTTGTTGCGTNPPGTVTPAVCVQGTNNGTACANDGTCTGGGVCRGHLDCTALYFGSGQPSGINLPATIPDRGLSYSKIASCSGDTVNLSPTASGDVPGPGCSTPAGTPTYGQRHCTSPGCLFGAPLAIPNPSATATGTCVHNVISTAGGAGTGTASCSTGATNLLTLPLDSKIYLTGAIEPVKVCSTCVGGTPGVCGSGTCSGTSGARNGMPCTPETSALSGQYPTSHDCPAPNAPAGGGTCGVNSGTFIGCLPIAFALSSGTQTLTSFATGAQARVFCGFCFDPNVSSAFASPPDPCTTDAECVARGDNFDSCRQHNNGAFRNSFATTITETGSPAGDISDGMPHASTLVSVFCIPPSYDPIVDPTGELPGPGAVSLPGFAQLIP
jgi:hypothetical protein